MGRLHRLHRPETPHGAPHASGDIAHVLRQARASLKDASRPYSPAERRLRSADSLFGEGGFRYAQLDRGTAQGGSVNCRRRNSSASVKRTSSGHVPRLKTHAGKCQLKKHAASSSRSDRAGTPTEIAHLPGKWPRRGSNKPLGALNPTTEAMRGSSIVDNGSPAGSVRQRSSRLWTTDPGKLYLDQGRLYGARSRSIANHRDVGRSSRSISVSSSNSSESSRGKSGSRKENKRGMEMTTKDSHVPTSGGSGDYEGLYGSDVDADTTAWDLGSVHSGVSANREEDGGEAPLARTNSSRVESDGGSSDVDFVLDAIDNEVDLGAKGLGFHDDEDDVGSEAAGPPRNGNAFGDHEGSGRDASPDPGTLEEERERNGRLAGLLQMLRHALHRTTDDKPEGIGEDGVGEGSRSPTTSTVSTTRALQVLLRVMNRPQGSEDASPPSIAELPSLLAARSIISLVLLPLLPSGSISGSAGFCRRSSEAPPDDGRADRRSKRGQLLMKACRHMFEVSKRSGADDAFISSGIPEGLMEFVEFAASELDSISAETFLGGGGGARKIGVKACRRNKRGGGGGGIGDSSNIPASCPSSSLSNDSCSDTSRTHSEECSVDDPDEYIGGNIGSVFDSLTFAMGCLKNLSAGERAKDGLVLVCSVQALCRLIRSTRDLCRRCECPHRQKRGARTSNTMLLADARGKTMNLFGASAGSPGEQLNIDTEGGIRQDNAILLRKRVSPFLAQGISLLRDLAVGEKSRSDSFQAADVVGTLCSILRPFRSCQDVVLNTARVLAKLSLQEKTRAEINSDAGHMRDLFAALIEQGRGIAGGFTNLERNYRTSSRSAAPLAAVSVEHRRVWESQEKRLAAYVRIAFALGNLTSASDENRSLIGIRLGGAESLPALLLACTRAHLSASKCLRAVDSHHAVVDDGKGRGARLPAFCVERWERTSLRCACDGVEDVLVKTVRLLANISVHREVGQRVCRQPGLVALEPLLDKCLELFGLSQDGALPQQRGVRSRIQGSERHEKMVPGEELLLNTVSLVTNLSFYGPGANEPAAPLPDRVSPDESTAAARSPGGSDGDSCGGRRELVAPLLSAIQPHVSVLFALASKARRRLEEQESTLVARPVPSSIGVAPVRHGDGRLRGEAGTSPMGTSHPSRHPIATGGTGEDHGAGFKRHEVLCGHLVKVLLHPNAEAVAEAARAFGNFSRDPSCRAAIAERRGDEVLVALLGHPCREVVFAAAGAIVNLAGDRAGRARLSGEEVGAGERLARLVRRAGLADPGMAGLACQALHNLLMVEEPPPGGGHGGALRDVLGGPEAYNKLWWTLQELTEACSWEGRSVGGQPGQSRDELGGFLAAAKAVWGAMKEGSSDRAPDDSLYEEL